MPSMNYETEKAAFRDFYNDSRDTLEGARNAFVTLVRSLLATDPAIAGAKVEGRIKDREGALDKFRLKYQTGLETAKREYAIRDHISDLIGLRVVCSYEDDVEQVRALIASEFKVLGVTDKTALIEGTDDAFGYKGLHMDLQLNKARRTSKEYAAYAPFPFELQIRTVIQDSWSTLDHRIKYKKVIPHDLKRRINALAAVFEMADREFRAIRDETLQAIEQAAPYQEIEAESAEVDADPAAATEPPPRQYSPLDAFSLLRIAKHFFKGYDFDPHKIDGFTQEIVQLKPDVSRGKFNFYLREAITDVRRYKAAFQARNEGAAFGPFTEMRHSLYAGDPTHFAPLLTDRARANFDAWRKETRGVT